MKPNGLLRALLFLLIMCGSGSRAAAQGVYSMAADFSLAGNPNGVWRYGTTGTALTGSLTLFTSFTTSFSGNPNVHAWTGTESAFGNNYPFVGKNTAATGQDGGGGFVPLLPGQLFMAPSPTGSYCVSRFTTPAAGLYQVDAFFQGRDVRGTTTDVHILLNGVSIFDGIVNGFDAPSNQSYSGQVSLSVGDRLDFAVGYGPNLTFFQDSTALAATIAAVPEPATMALGAIGLAMPILAVRSRQRKARRTAARRERQAPTAGQ